jgi:hypothetical protein
MMLVLQTATGGESGGALASPECGIFSVPEDRGRTAYQRESPRIAGVDEGWENSLLEIDNFIYAHVHSEKSIKTESLRFRVLYSLASSF